MSAPGEGALEDPQGPDEHVVLVEAGGTHLRAAVAHPTGPGQVRRAITPSRTATDAPDVDVVARTVDAIVAIGRAVGDGAVPTRAVVAWPGPTTPEGVVYASPTVAGPTRGLLHVDELLSSGWDSAQVRLVNDMTAAGLPFVADGLADFAILTVGSGIGHKVFADGRPVVGPGGRGGELGHVVVRDGDDALPCDCGGRGHLGAHASGRAIVRQYVARSGGAEAYDSDDTAGAAVVAALVAGDGLAQAVVGDAADLLGRALAGLHVGVGVERFLLVGGFAAAAGEPYRRLVVDAAAASCWDLGLDWDAAVSVHGRDEDLGLVGAWLVARDTGWV